MDTSSILASTRKLYEGLTKLVVEECNSKSCSDTILLF